MINARLMLRMLTVMTAAFVFSYCSEEEENPAGSFSYDSKEITVKNAEFLYSATQRMNANQQTYYQHALLLLGKGIRTDEYGGLSGNGDVLYFGLTTTGMTLEATTYPIVPQEIADTPNLAWDATLFNNILVVSGNSDREVKIVSGTVKVEKTDNIYTITIAGVDENQNTITGIYTGEVKVTEGE